MSEQLRLFEQAEAGYRAEDLIAGEGNRGALALLDGAHAWPGGALALVGPAGSGKTHLATEWALRCGAGVLGPEIAPADLEAAFRARGGRLVLEAAERAAEAALWLALDLARLHGGSLLWTARQPPRAWPADTADLRSRLAALAVCEIGPPDLQQLALLLRRLARLRFLELTPEVAAYCAQRLPRRWEAAQEFVAALDRACFRGVEPISYDTARRALRTAFAGALAQAEDEAFPGETQHE